MAFGIVNRKQIGRSSGYTIELADVTNATATAANKKVNLTWDDPSDVMLEGATLAKWGGTLVVRKTNSPPVDKDDGTLVINSTTRNAYSTTPLQDTNLENGVIYYYRFFPYSANETYTFGTTISAKPAAAKVDVPIITADFTYDGTTKTPTLNYDSMHIIATGDFSATNAGEYEVTFTLKDNIYAWNDGTFAPKTITWNIAKAAGEVTIPDEWVILGTSITSKTLAITQVGDGELSVESGASFMVKGTIDGSNLIISRVGTNVGTCQMTVKAAESNNYTAAAQVVFNVTVSNYKYMTVTIDESNSNPETCCTYDDNAIDMEPGSADWDTFFGHYPCLFKNGVEGVKLNPNNFDQDVNGNTVDISSGDSGDAMVAFPKRGLWMSKTGTVVTITMTDNPNDPDFEYMAHRRGDTLKDKFYIGVYMGSEADSKLRSLKGKSIAINKTHDAFETLAKANGAPNGNGGSGYDQHGWYQLIYLQAMYVLKYKNLNSQTVIGRGVIAATASTAAKGKTGGTETNGMDWGNPSSGLYHMKLFGIEDLWGNIYSCISGFWYDTDGKICTATENFNNDGSGYTDRGVINSSSSNFVTEIVGTTHGGFLPISTSAGSSTTYYCDKSIVSKSRLLRFGGYWSGGFSYGIFDFEVSRSKSNYDNHTGSRLMYL